MCEIEVEVGHDVLEANEELALRNRHLLNGFGIIAFNIMGAIGSGKTTLIELAIERLGCRYRIGVIAGDIVADIDANRFKRYGVPVIAMNTGKECHLDALLVKNALDQLPLEDLDILLIENVGNLICPADYSLGESKRVVIVSVSEGDDIVEKHPMIFRTCDLAIVNKVDISEAVGADADKMVSDALRLNPSIKVLKTSKKVGESIDGWIEFIEESVDAYG
ncbi:MAG: hydrogenase nickel incorporation protein HypB [Methanocellales archaeon]|nr:hydrogenase nickel incorporation protein HypB [Methanocellales archaeon]MDD3291701.1 hydrogenase nickel incorporation protein HypB [Methanocellales archaeon]MDD5235051.1 hydrogenase nickel incorporation protein HypB [Methanocellales archaeon]MDD5485189.1 hydrogenase nickel incorporation protein HypB [Methanocellales archaeon]